LTTNKTTQQADQPTSTPADGSRCRAAFRIDPTDPLEIRAAHAAFVIAASLPFAPLLGLLAWVAIALTIGASL
jgi:hypothetical protein